MSSDLPATIARYSASIFGVAVVGTMVGDLVVRHWRRTLDLIGSLASIVSGLSFLAMKKVVASVVGLAAAWFVYEHRVFSVDLRSPWTWLGVFLARDLVYYWVHRLEHRVRVLWASHMVHHSPTTISFSTAVRVPWMEALYKPWFGLWAPLIGFNPIASIALDVFAAVVSQLQHTTAVKRRTILDAVFVTPSAHRVHHASNHEYLDKNFGAVLIIWDRLFGTYVPETNPAVFGLTGGKTLSTAREVLTGGYPTLAAATRREPTLRGALRLLVTAP